MKQNRFFVLMVSAVLLTFGLVLAGCDNDSTNSGNFVPVTNITNVPVIALVNNSLSLSGTIEPPYATNKTIFWSGANIINGVFTATSPGYSTVTAIIVNGASESSPYIKNFTIMVYADANPIALAQGIWTRVVTQGGTQYTIKMTITNNNWQLSITPFGGSEIPDCKGIIVSADAANLTYASQQTHKYREGSWVSDYSYETGTYTLSNSNKTLTLTANNQDSKATGTWTKQGS